MEEVSGKAIEFVMTNGTRYPIAVVVFLISAIGMHIWRKSVWLSLATGVGCAILTLVLVYNL